VRHLVCLMSGVHDGNCSLPATRRARAAGPSALRCGCRRLPNRMPKASRVLAALKRDGWVETRRSGSHRVLVKGSRQRIWAYHDGVDLGGPAMARVARDYGYTVDQLRRL